MAFFDGMPPPSWLRWILFLPLALIASLLTFVIMICVGMFADLALAIIGIDSISLRRELFYAALGTGFTAFVLVWVGASIAPKAKFSISIILVGLFCLPAGFILMEAFSVPDRSTIYPKVYFEVIIVASGLIGAVAACNLIYKKGKAQDVDDEVIDINDLLA